MDRTVLILERIGKESEENKRYLGIKWEKSQMPQKGKIIKLSKKSWENLEKILMEIWTRIKKKRGHFELIL